MTKQETSVIGARSRLRGRVSGDGSVVVEGELDGDLRVSGSARIASGGVVRGDVEAQDLVVGGTLEGDVRATGTVAVGSEGTLLGELQAGRVKVEPGARVSVRLDMKLTID